MGIKSLIIDDDPFIRDMLQDKLAVHFPEVEVVQVAGSGTEGIDLIRRLRPDLIFLDVEMADMTGFEMLAQLDEIFFQTIFITSYSHYAIKAIRFNALDYILKPIDLGELRDAIRRYQENLQKKQSREYVRQALDNLKAPDPSEEILMLNLQEGEIRLPLKNILHIQGERNYSYIHLTNQPKKLCAKILGDFEDILSDKGFFRCHKSHLVNGIHVVSVPNKTCLKLSDQSEILVSRRKKKALDLFLEHFS